MGRKVKEPQWHLSTEGFLAHYPDFGSSPTPQQLKHLLRMKRERRQLFLYWLETGHIDQKQFDLLKSHWSN